MHQGRGNILGLVIIQIRSIIVMAEAGWIARVFVCTQEEVKNC